MLQTGLSSRRKILNLLRFLALNASSILPGNTSFHQVAARHAVLADLVELPRVQKLRH
jgi:hypothetical protein